ncbi:hypothetical protein ACIQV3_23610 [Streptomyces sp. NPDC099050]|uniref:hypothetical protein n=1 Tax=Streptomyces sp. NPDC099050 TaxID=3366100 RepID=UPI0038063CAF
MRLRRTATTTGTLFAALVLGLASAGGAHAAEIVQTSGTSAKGGWGVGTVLTNGYSVDYLSVCDRGNADGRRATAEIWRTWDRAYYSYVDAEHGSGTCNDDTWLPDSVPKGTYTLRVCLRNGPSGSFEACSSRQFSV